MLGQRLRQSCMCLIFNWTPEREGVGVPNTLRYVLTSFKLVSLRVYGQIVNITLVNRIVESQHIIITFPVIVAGQLGDWAINHVYTAMAPCYMYN